MSNNAHFILMHAHAYRQSLYYYMESLYVYYTHTTFLKFSKLGMRMRIDAPIMRMVML